jgi:hypothetical protein
MHALRFVLRLAADFTLPVVVVWVVFGVVTLVGLSAGRQRANRRFKPRFARWTGRDYQMGDDVEKMLWESRGP